LSNGNDSFDPASGLPVESIETAAARDANHDPAAESLVAAESENSAAENGAELAVAAEPAGPQAAAGDDHLLFRSWSESGYGLSPRQLLRIERVPHFGHFCILVVVVLFALFSVGMLTHFVLQAHLFGIATTQQASANVRFMLATQGVLYMITLAISLVVFPLVWGKSLLAGVHWNAPTAFRFRKRLLGAAFLCFLLAIANGLLLPGPTDAPIDKIFRTPGVAWMLFAFGVTFAPFFEEMAFRGFLLPTLCTAIDWFGEMNSGRLPLRPCHNGHPRWSMPAMVASSILTSIPFALIHAEQTAYSIGPFLLLMAVSLVLCWVRLSTRSLAASVLVHASYNFMIFSLMLIGTGGFQHLDKM
jgi:membrane protease YdiL (CAAX protease family)